MATLPITKKLPYGIRGTRDMACDCARAGEGWHRDQAQKQYGCTDDRQTAGVDRFSAGGG